MTRKAELLEAVNNDVKVVPLINDMVYLENQLDQLRALPKIRVDEVNPQSRRPHRRPRCIKNTFSSM